HLLEAAVLVGIRRSRCRMATESGQKDVVALWTAAQPAVSAYIATLVPHFHDAEAILQSVALIAIRKNEQYDAATSFLRWCIGLSRLEVLNWWRRHGREKLIFDDEALQLITAAQQQLESEVLETKQALRHCMGRLTARAKKMLELRYLQDLRSPAIANRMGMS